MEHFNQEPMVANIINPVSNHYALAQPMSSIPATGYSVHPSTNWSLHVVDPRLGVCRDQFCHICLIYMKSRVSSSQQQAICQSPYPVVVQHPPPSFPPYNPSIPPPSHVTSLPLNNPINPAAPPPEILWSNLIAARNALQACGSTTQVWQIPSQQQQMSSGYDKKHNSGIQTSAECLPLVPVTYNRRNMAPNIEFINHRSLYSDPWTSNKIGIPDREKGEVFPQQSSSSDEKYWTIAKDTQYWEKERRWLPNNDTMTAIVNQIEFYLSNDYLANDKYLLRTIRCKKDGYISLRLMTAFKKIKKLTKQCEVVRSAIVRQSRSIVVSLDGARLRRRANLPEELRKPREISIVLVVRLPEVYNSVENLTSLFRRFGKINLVRILPADKEVPSELRNYATQIEDLGKSLCAVVEFENPGHAILAVRALMFFQRQNNPSLSFPENTSQENTNELENLVAEYIEELKKEPLLGDTRLALLGPRVKSNLYQQDRKNKSQLGKKSTNGVVVEIDQQFAENNAIPSELLEQSSAQKGAARSSNVSILTKNESSDNKQSSPGKLTCAQVDCEIRQPHAQEKNSE